MQESAINDNFAKMTEALYVAEQSARQAVEMRSKVQREIAAKEKEKKDRELRELAIKARQDRLGGGGAPVSLAARENGTEIPGPPARDDEVCLGLPHLLSMIEIQFCKEVQRKEQTFMHRQCQPS